MKINVSNIQWEIDDDSGEVITDSKQYERERLELGLPLTECFNVNVNDYGSIDEVYDAVPDMLSDMYGFLVQHCDIDIQKQKE